MPQCPKCKAEYPPDAERCLVCRIDLTEAANPMPPDGPLPGFIQCLLMCMMAFLCLIGAVAIGGFAAGVAGTGSKLGEATVLLIPFAAIVVVAFAIGYAAGMRLTWPWICLGWSVIWVPIAFLYVFGIRGPGDHTTLLEWLYLPLPITIAATSIIGGKAFKRRRDPKWVLIPVGWMLAGIAVVWR